MKPLSLFSLAILTLVYTLTAAAASPTMDATLLSKAERAADNGMRFLREQQAEDGSWSKSVGITALALRAFLESRRKYDEEDGPFITRPVKFILDHVQKDGSIADSISNRNYTTAVAITALQATGNPAYKMIISNAQKFLAGLQVDEDEGYKPDHKYYGGIGYGGDERPDLSNIYMAMEALNATRMDEADPLWEKARTFISRSQNNSETNDQAWAGNDGGFAYMPGYSPHGNAASYGGMTHAGLLSLLFAGVDKNDPRVKAAYNWIRANYTLDENPGASENQGLYYYYNVFSKSMYAFGEPLITDTRGVTHNWRDDLAGKLISLQNKDGSWVNNDSPRWWEGDKNLVTAWSVIALNHLIR